MQTLVLFDIGSTRLRNLIINTCFDFGLDRIQFSVFQGELRDKSRDKIKDRFVELIEAHTQQERGPQRGQALQIHMFPICSEEIAKAVHLGRNDVQKVQTIEVPKNLFL